MFLFLTNVLSAVMMFEEVHMPLILWR